MNEELVLVIRSEVANAVSGLQKVQGEADKTGGKADKLAGKFDKLGKKMTLGLTLPLAAAGAAMVNLASDADESASKAQTVFGEFFDDIDAKANNLADSFTRQEYHDFAGTLGSIALGLGFTQKEAAKLSEESLGLAQDLGSFHNTSTEDAINAITAAMTGEREQLKKYGIVINEATVKQKAMEMGLSDGTEALDAQSKALATQALIFDLAGPAVGDFARTSDGLANKTKIVTGNIKDAAANLGANLLPIVLKVVDAVGKLVNMFLNMPEPVQKIVLAIGGLLAVAGPILMIVAKMITVFTTLKPVLMAIGAAMGGISLPVLAVVAAIAAAIAIGILIWKKWDVIFPAIKKVVEPVMNFIKDLFDSVMNFIRPLVEVTLNVIKTVFQTVFNVVKGIVEFVFKAITTYFKVTFKIWETIFYIALWAIKGIFSTVTDAIKAVWEFVWGKIGGTVKKVAGTIKSTVEGIARTISSVFNGIKGTVQRIWNGIYNFFVPKITALKNKFVDGFTEIKDKISGIFSGFGTIIKNAFKSAMNWVIDKINWAIDKINGIIGGMNKVPGVNISKISKLSNLGFGGENLAGSFTVGDRGKPEVVTLPAGSSVKPLPAMGGAGGGGLTINLNAPQNDPMGVGRAVGWELAKRGMA